MADERSTINGLYGTAEGGYRHTSVSGMRREESIGMGVQDVAFKSY